MRRKPLLLLLALVVVVVIVVVYLLGTPEAPIVEKSPPPPAVKPPSPLQADAEGSYVPGYQFSVNQFRFTGVHPPSGCICHVCAHALRYGRVGGLPRGPHQARDRAPPVRRPPGGHGDGRRQVPHSIRDEPTRCRGPHRRRDGSRWERRGLVPRAGFVPMAARQIVRSVACSAYKAITFSSYRRPGD